MSYEYLVGGRPVEIPQFVRDFELQLDAYLGELHSSIDEATEAHAIKLVLKDMIKECDFYRRGAFRHMANHLGYSYSEIGEMFGISRQRVDQIIHTYG